MVTGVCFLVGAGLPLSADVPRWPGHPGENGRRPWLTILLDQSATSNAYQFNASLLCRGTYVCMEEVRNVASCLPSYPGPNAASVRAAIGPGGVIRSAQLPGAGTDTDA
jgi:hypothetical protein